MEITIDTKKDSAEDIRKAIDFLKQFAGEQKEPAAAKPDFPLAGMTQNVRVAKQQRPAEKPEDILPQAGDDELKIIPY